MNSTPRAVTLVVALLFVGALGACRKSVTGPNEAGPSYASTPVNHLKGAPLRFAIHPLYNPSKLVRKYQPLVDHLNTSIPEVQFVLEASRDYADYERKIGERAPEFLLANPWQSLEAMKVGYAVIAMAGEPGDFKGLFIVRRDSGISRVGDLRGQTAAYPASTALAACIMPQWFLYTQGLDVNRDLTNKYVGSQESAIMSAYLRQAAVGVTWPPPWRAFLAEHPQEAAQLQVLWETEPLVSNSIMARQDVPGELRDRVRALLLGQEQTPAGHAILANCDTARFLPASDADYEVVRRFITRFETEVRVVKPRP